MLNKFRAKNFKKRFWANVGDNNIILTVLVSDCFVKISALFGIFKEQIVKVIEERIVRVVKYLIPLQSQQIDIILHNPPRFDVPLPDQIEPKNKGKTENYLPNHPTLRPKI